MFDFSKMKGSSGDTAESFTLEWSEAAKARIGKVPAGFMRSMTVSRVEAAAKESGASQVALEFLETELADSANMMQSMMGGGRTKKKAIPTTSKEKSSSPDTYYCEICGFTAEFNSPRACSNCKSPPEKQQKLGEKEREGKVSPTSGLVLSWEREALIKLEEVPQGFMQDLTRWRVERLSRACGVKTVTGRIFDEKYEEWGEASNNYTIEMPWDEEVVLKVAKIPSFVRGIIQREVEKAARLKGASSVTSYMLQEIRDRWESGVNFHKR